MEYILQILIVFVVIGCALKLSFWKFWQACLFGIVCAAFIVVSCRWAIVQSKAQLAAFLANARVAQDAAVLVTVESALFFAFCFAELRAASVAGERKWWRPLLRQYPGLLIFPTLFYLETRLVFALPGVGFTSISYLTAAAAAIVIPLSSLLVRRLCRERELRLEILFLAALFVCAVGLIATVNGNVTYAPVEKPANLKVIVPAAGAFIALFGAGLVLNKLKWNKKNGNHI